MDSKRMVSETPGIEFLRNKNNELTGYKFRCCVARDENYKQVWRLTVIPADDERLEGLKGKALIKMLNSLKVAWDQQQKDEYKKNPQKTDKEKDKSKTTLKEFIDNTWWPLRVMGKKRSPSGVQFYEYTSKNILSYFGGRIRINQIDEKKVLEYLKYMNTEAISSKGQHYSKTTIQHHFGTLRNILKFAKKLHYISENPCQEMDSDDKPHRDSKRIDFLEPAQARRFIQCLDDEPLFWRTFVNILMTCGLRRGECIGLQWNDIDPEKLTLTISRNVRMDKYADEKYSIGTTKTGEERTVSITPRVYGLLMQLKRQQEEHLNMVLMPTCFIFSRATDPFKPIYPTEPTRFMSKFVKRHNLPNMSPHDLRHTAATLALESGANLKEVQELLGHKDPSVTMTFYAGVTEEAKRRTVEGIERLIS